MSFENTKQTIFTGTELDYEGIVEIPEGYEKAELKDFEDGTLIIGRPEMASVSSFTFNEDGEEKTVNRFKLYLNVPHNETVECVGSRSFLYLDCHFT